MEPRVPIAAASDVDHRVTRRGTPTWISWLILAFGTASTMALYQFSERWIHATAEARLQSRSQELEAALQAKVNSMGAGLRGAQAYVGQNETVTPQSWQRLYETLRLDENFPGLQALVHLRALKGEELMATVEQQRRLSGRDFVVQPPGRRDFHVLITTLAWREDRYTRPLGADVWSSPLRRVALEAARDSGNPSITAMVDLITDPEPDQGPAFLIYQPFYRGGVLPDSVSQRRDELAGFVGVSVRYRALMRQLLSKNGQDLLVQLYDSAAAEAGPAKLAYSDSMPDPGGLAGLRQAREFEVGGRRWTLVTNATGQFLQPLEQRFPWLLLIGGTLVTLLLFAWSRSQIGQRLRAEKRATEMSREAFEAGERLNTILDNVEAYIYIKDTDYRYRYANHKTCAHFGRRLAEIVGCNDHELLGDQQTPRIRADDQRVIEGGERVAVQESLVAPDGAPIHFLTVKIPLRDAQGRVHALCGISTDITELKEAQLELERYRQQLQQMVDERTVELEATTAALREASAEQQAIFDTATVGLLLIRNHVIQRCNRTLEELCGYGRDEIVGQHERLLIPDPASYDALSLEVASAMQATGRHLGEHELVRKDGSRFWARMSARLLHPGNPLAGIVGMIQDITDERAAVETLRRARDLAEQATRAKSDFLANMSHEIRTPMNAVLGMTHLALRANPEPRQREYLQKIQMSGQHLLGIINDILDFSKIESGKLELEHTDFDLERLLNDLALIVSEQAASKGLELIVHIDADVPCALRGDPMRLRQILLNFLSNAVKFTEQGGMAKPRILNEVRGKRVLVVDDNRTAREVLVAMLRSMGFIPVQAASGAAALHELRAMVVAGTPCDLVLLDWHMPEMDGIATAKEIRRILPGPVPALLLVTAYGRERVANDVTDAGISELLVKPVSPSTLLEAIMRICRPGNEGKSVSQPVISPALPDLDHIRGARVLLVDDNDLNQEVASALLQQAGLVVTIAGNGAIALDKVRSGHYDLILMDMQMPVMDGLEATRRIRQMPGLENVPILAMTANAMAGDRNRCLAAGMNDHIAKPIDPDDLLAKLHHWVKPVVRVPAAASGTGAVRPGGEDALPSVWYALDGLDAAAGLKNALGRPRLYLSLLRKFVDGQSDYVNRIRSCLAQEDWATAQRLAHTLKGTAAQIGATALRAQAEALEYELKDTAPAEKLEPLLAGTGTQLAQLTDAIAHHL